MEDGDHHPRIASGGGAAAAPPPGGSRGAGRAEPSRAEPRSAVPFLPVPVMSSAGSLSTMQRLVEQLKLEAAVERIKVSRAARGNRGT